MTVEKVYKHNQDTYTITRYPKTEDKTLKAWSNAEVYALEELNLSKDSHLVLYNDRFGFWNTTLNQYNPTTIWHFASQKKAVKQNLLQNNLPCKEEGFKTVLEPLDQDIDIALVKIPKSVDAFQYILEHIHKNSHSNTEVICCFMTKYFNKQIIERAQLYFEEVTQSLAWKKSRLMRLKQPKQKVHAMNLTQIEFENTVYKQYPGVFSASHIDYATQFLMEHLVVKQEEKEIMDLASGNGVLAKFVQGQNPEASVLLMDDFNLAIESSKLNVNADKATFLCEDIMNDLADNTFDLVVSNPPFHFEHENNIEVTLQLMKHVHRCLKPNGRFVFVANAHLNYKTHLIHWFTDVKEVARNSKFVICSCTL